MLKTGIYVRVSTEEQVQEGFSIRGQTEKLKAYTLIKEWELYEVYTDEGISGKNIVDRPAITRLIEDIKEGKVNNVLVFKVDRLTRSTKNLIELVEVFDKYHCAFNSLTESIDTETPSGRMFLKIIGIFAEFERENLSSRTKLGFERKVKEGYTLANWSLSYGYSKKKGQKIQVIEPNEEKIVKEIFDMYVNKNTAMSKIAKTLNERKIQTKRSGIMWDATIIKLILTNPTYIGKVRYLGLEKDKYIEADGHHEPIISNDIYNSAQEKIKTIPKYYKTKRPYENNYFCGTLFCGICGAKFTTHHYSCKTDENGIKTSKASYRCNNKKYVSKETSSCIAGDIMHSKVEQAFSEYIEKMNTFTEAENADIPSDNNIEEVSENIIDCQNKLNNFQKKKQQVLEQYINEEISFAEYKEMVKVVNEKCTSLELELKNIKSSTQGEQKKEILKEDIILNLKENWNYLTNSERMIFLQKFVKKIEMTVIKESSKSSVAIIQKIEFN